MNKTVIDDIEEFLSSRLSAAEESLTCNDFFQSENFRLEDAACNLRANLNAEQTKLYEAVAIVKETTSSIRERNAYRAGFRDGLKVMAKL